MYHLFPLIKSIKDEFSSMLLSTEEIKILYPKGTRIVCDYMDDPFPVPSGTKGTVTYVDDIGTIHVQWDNGRTLGIRLRVDKITIISD